MKRHCTLLTKAVESNPKSTGSPLKSPVYRLSPKNWNNLLQKLLRNKDIVGNPKNKDIFELLLILNFHFSHKLLYIVVYRLVSKCLRNLMLHKPQLAAKIGQV